MAANQRAVDGRAVGRSEVFEYVDVVAPNDACVLTGDSRVGQGDGTFGGSANLDGVDAYGEAATVLEEELSGGSADVLVDDSLDVESAGLHFGAGPETHFDPADQTVPFFAGVLASGCGELAREGFFIGGKLRAVLRRHRHQKMVGGDETFGADRSLVIHFAGDSLADFDRLQTASERPGNAVFEDTFERALEPLEDHRGSLRVLRG